MAEPDQTIQYRFSVNITRDDSETAKDISEEIQAAIENIAGVDSVRELAWRRLSGGEQ